MTASASRVVARPRTGPVIGEAGVDGILRYRGIRYGRARRFERSEPVELHVEPVDATTPGSICPQWTSRLEAVMGPQAGAPEQSEDCLFLSVSTPDLSGVRPVMVWIHGGAFLSGGGTLPWYDGGQLAAEEDVVVVSVNYRLGALGFLVHEGVCEGDLGLRDQALALEWVRDNIEAFGGDPDLITLFGQSAGALSVLAHTCHPHTKTIGRRAILQSMPSVDVLHHRADAQAVGADFVEALDADPRQATIEQILDAQRVATGSYAARNSGMLSLPFVPVLGGYVDQISGTAAAERDEPLQIIVGWTRDELAAFAVGVTEEQGRSEILAETEPVFVQPAFDVVESCTRAGGEAYVYELSWAPVGGHGAVHCLEIPLLLGTAESWSNSPMLGVTSWPAVEHIGQPLRRAWARLARTGSPGSPTWWPRWTPDAPHVLAVDGALIVDPGEQSHAPLTPTTAQET